MSEISQLQSLKDKAIQINKNAEYMDTSIPFGGDQTWEKLLTMPLGEEQVLRPIGYINDLVDSKSWPLCTKIFHRNNEMRFSVYMPPYSRFILHCHSDVIETLSNVDGYVWGAKTFYPEDDKKFEPFSLANGETITFKDCEWHWLKTGKKGTFIQVDFKRSNTTQTTIN